MGSYFDRLNRNLDEISDEKRSMDQHVTSLEQDATATSRHGGRRARKHEDSRAHEGHRYSRTSDAWG